MSLLNPSESIEAIFKTTVHPLKQFYAEGDVSRAIHSLIQFYKDEAFDNEDITNDWVPGDFENCDGIDQFMDSLNYTQRINSPQNKQVLFNWFCHWLLPNVPQPSFQPEHAITNTASGPLRQLDPDHSATINTIAYEFSLQLSINLGVFQNCHPLRIADTFVQFCKDEGYTKIEDFVSDLDDIDGSFIMEAIMKEYPEYERVKEEIFDILYDIVALMKYNVEDYFILNKYHNYPPFALSKFQWNTTPAHWRITNKLCTKEIPSLFKNDVDEQHPNEDKDDSNDKRARDTEDKDDWALMSAKALDVQNRFPLLNNLIDAFARYRAEENCKFWSESQCNSKDIDIRNIRFRVKPRSKEQAQHRLSVLLSPANWMKDESGNAHGLYRFIQNTHVDAEDETGNAHVISTADYIVSALGSLMKRSLHKFDFNHITDPTIYDDYSIYCLYMCAMNKFVYSICDPKGQKQTQDEHLPLQIDFWIIPRLAMKNVHVDYQIPTGLNDFKWDDDDQGDDMANPCEPEKLHLGKSDNTQNENAKIWNLKDNLERAGYQEGVDYWCYQPHQQQLGDYREDTLKQHIGQLWNKNRKWQDTRYARYIMIIDRRDPDHIKHKNMKNNTHKRQTWTDKMYLIRPKLKPPNAIKETIHYDKIAKQFAFVLNETFIANTKEYLFPMPGLKKGVYSNDFGGLDAGNGYKFVVSFHLHFSNKVKMYWYYGHGATRFFMRDISWLWPRYFKLRDDIKDKNRCDSFQKLSDDAKVALYEAVNNYPLRDRQFDQFVDQINSPPFKGTQQ
eukprot:116831_1